MVVVVVVVVVAPYGTSISTIFILQYIYNIFITITIV